MRPASMVAEAFRLSTIRASVAIFDQTGDEVAVEGPLTIRPGDDPGTLGLWVDGAGMVIQDREAFMAELAALPVG